LPSGPEVVESYRGEVSKAVSRIIEQEDSFSAAALKLKDEIAHGGGEEAAEEIILRAIRDGV
jgi:hypothetical protein